ncbi:MAG: gamma-glutamylcyclotransferase family protein [Gammaproteobacteria bacterium]
MAREYLFVYGTLRRDCGSAMAQWLSRHASFSGKGSFPGMLYEIDRYPGAVFCSDRQCRVVGELYRLHDLNRVLTVLDDYEECSSRFSKPHEYKRIKSDIQLLKGGSACAWVYVYNLPVSQFERIESGDYVSYMLRKSII